MRIVEYTGYKEVLPDEGKVLTDGESIAFALMTPLNVDVTMWYEIDKPEDDEQDI